MAGYLIGREKSLHEDSYAHRLLSDGKINPVFINTAAALWKELAGVSDDVAQSASKKEFVLSLLRAGDISNKRQTRLFSAFYYYAAITKYLSCLSEETADMGRTVGLILFEEMRITSEEFDIIEDDCVNIILKDEESEAEVKKKAIATVTKMVRAFRDLVKYTRYSD